MRILIIKKNIFKGEIKFSISLGLKLYIILLKDLLVVAEIALFINIYKRNKIFGYFLSNLKPAKKKRNIISIV